MARVALLALIVLAGCGGSRPAQACRPTVPGGDAPKGFNYGSDELAVELWPDGKLVAGTLPDGGSYADIKPDGSIVAKLGWWRGAEGTLAITGERTDAHAPPLSADVPDGYGPTGFQATGITFASTGCWDVTGHVGAERLTFTVLVSRSWLGSPKPNECQPRLNAATISRSNSMTCSSSR
jgi:hypothetical protein